MIKKSKIKVVRKSEIPEAKVERVEASDGSKNSARKIVTNVSSWVSDLQKRKRAETKDALDKLFPANPQTDSA